MTARPSAPFGAALLVALGLAAPAAAQNTAVTFGTNWVAQAEHGGFYQAVADGTYAACGLDVSIVPGGPQVNNQALMLAGRLDFYMGGVLDAFFAVEEGLPIVNVAAMFQKDPQVLLTHPGAVSSFEDLKSLPTLMISDGGYSSYYQWMKSAYGFTDEQRVPYTYNAAPFLVDTESAMQGYLTSETFIVEKEGGFAPDVWLIADAGYTSYSTTIQALRETVETRPEVVQCFVDGSIIGWYNYLYGDNSAANEAIKAANPDMTDELIAFAIDKLKGEGVLESGDALTMGIGVMTDVVMQDFYAKMVEAGVVPAGLDISQSYTTQFMGKGVGMDLKPM
jgi:NitT/TauT family transport system substrate-binding protein